MPCPWLESSSVRGTCHGVWLIYPVTFHNLVLLTHDDNTTFSKEDTIQAIMLKVKYKKTCPGGETCRGGSSVHFILSDFNSPWSSVPGHRAYHRKSLPSLRPQNVRGKHLQRLPSSPGLMCWPAAPLAAPSVF